jgi:hypothetical protein
MTTLGNGHIIMIIFHQLFLRQGHTITLLTPAGQGYKSAGDKNNKNSVNPGEKEF